MRMPDCQEERIGLSIIISYIIIVLFILSFIFVLKFSNSGDFKLVYCSLVGVFSILGLGSLIAYNIYQYIEDEISFDYLFETNDKKEKDLFSKNVSVLFTDEEKEDIIFYIYKKLKKGVKPDFGLRQRITKNIDKIIKSVYIYKKY